MNEVDQLRKRLADTQAGEKGWRKALATAQGSFSRTLAQKNLSRLAASREILLAQLKVSDSPRSVAGEVPVQRPSAEGMA